MALEEYKRKRNFKKTSEPTGGKGESDQLIFVVQKHQASHLHYDFRLELRGVLKSWAVPKGPSMKPEEKRLASHVEDHPIDYKDFEGIIPEGNYGAGTVIIWDRGTYKPVGDSGKKSVDEKELTKQFYAGKMSIVLKGEKLKGRFDLVKTPARSENAWLLMKHDDSYARKTDVTKKDKSVVSGFTLEQMRVSADVKTWKSNRNADGTLKNEEQGKEQNSAAPLPEAIRKQIKKGRKKAMPSKLEPMYATLAKEPFDDPQWTFEIKWDGYRTIAFLKNGSVQLRSRANQNFNFYEPVLNALKNWKVDAVLDGEIVVLDENGRSNYDALQKWKTTRSENLVYYVFDIIWVEGYDISHLPLTERKNILEQILSPGDVVRFSEGIDQRGKGFFTLAKENKLEGIVAKKKDSTYQPGKRGKDWLKFPTANRQEFVIGGWTESSGGRPFKSILFGYYNEKRELIYFGHAGSGFKQAEMPSLLKKFQSVEINKSPFANTHDRSEDKVHFSRPTLVGEFEYKSLTSGGKIRHPAIFLGLRADKAAREVVLEHPLQEKRSGNDKPKVDSPFSSSSNWPIILKQTITSRVSHEFDGKEVELTNIEKPLWGEVTKAHLLMYYHAVYPAMIPHLQNRPLSLHVKHISPVQPGLYIKDMEGHQPPWAEIFSVKRKHKAKGKRDVIDYLVCNDEATLQYIINLGCIDINPWTSTTSQPEQPDYIIIDLDPSDNDFSKAIEAAKAAKEFFQKNKLISFPKTSGKTGIHLYLPCSGFSFPQARTIAEHICSEVQQMVPGITTTEVSISARGDKLYLDHNQNDFADTVAAPYSVRPFHYPTVSAPLQWREVNSKLNPMNFTMENMPKRLEKKGDLFADVLSEKNRQKNSGVLKKFL
ncbi:MAG: DNA ligase D [Flavisolibacter sp.]